jgi:plasmid stabilization system protein ParE
LPVVYSVISTQAARAELIEAQDWYEGEATGLGRRFRQAVDALIERMTDNPRQFPVVLKNVRRALLRRFPYSLFFVVEDDVLIVIACFHASRNPLHLAKADLTSPHSMSHWVLCETSRTSRLPTSRSLNESLSGSLSSPGWTITPTLTADNQSAK